MSARLIEPGTATRAPIHVWARAPAQAALVQLRKLAERDYLVGHVAAMPDVHVAHGISVGTVFVTDRVIVPGALGGDLGCGVSGIRFPFPAAALDRRTLESLLRELSGVIPVGDATHRGRRGGEAGPPLSTASLTHEVRRLHPRHLGTLGGGNHFVELERDAAGDLWVLAHSGSRGIGSAIAAHHLRVASGSADLLAGLELDTPAGQACLADLEVAFGFAKENREILLDVAIAAITRATGVSPDPTSRVDAMHNFVRFEEHGGRKLCVHRKGAIAAEPGTRAIIPGSMGTASYLVEGLGETSSYRSASHGAGRVMTRREARASIRPAQLTQVMRRVVFDASKLQALVEEAPAAYRDIAEVLEDEEDLVTPVLRLNPIAVLKG